LLDPPVPPNVTISWFEGLAEEFALMPSMCLIFPESPDSLMMLGRHGTQRMKKPHVISAHAQKRSGAMKYIVSGAWAKVKVVESRRLAETEALDDRQLSVFEVSFPELRWALTYSKPTAKITEIPSFFCQFICRPQMIL
jgi:hypothetical protein